MAGQLLMAARLWVWQGCLRLDVVVVRVHAVSPHPKMTHVIYNMHKNNVHDLIVANNWGILVTNRGILATNLGLYFKPQDNSE